MPITTCDSTETLRTQIDAARKKVALDETEVTWDTIAQGILHLTHLCNSGGCEFPFEMVAGIRTMSRPLNSALNSERTRLSGAAVELLTALATGLGSSFEPLVSQFIPALLVLCGRTNKVFTSRARACVLAIIQQTRLPSLLPYLAELANHKSAFSRLIAAEAILACLNCINPPDLEKETRARIVEDFIKLTARDASADVRKTSKEIFKAYKLLMPNRVDNFITPLTPVVKKYLDIHTGPSGSQPAGQKQTSRPSSRTNNAAADMGPRATASTLSKPLVRPAPHDPVHGTRQCPVAHVPPPIIDTRAPRQRTVSQMRRDAPEPRNLQLNVQASGAAQRCAVPTSAPTHQAVRHPLPGPARAPPGRNPSSTTGPQRPPPMQLKFNPPDRPNVTGNGAKRVPLPSAPVEGSASEQSAGTAKSATIVDRPRPKPPTRRAEAVAPGKSVVGRDGTRSVSSTIKPAGTTSGQRTHKPSGQGGSSNPNKAAPRQRPVGNVQKSTRPLVETERKETSPTLVPLPPSPSIPPTEIPLPPSPDCTPRRSDHVTTSTPIPAKKPSEHPLDQGEVDNPTTPITTLLSSIQRGFLFTPSSPLSPPQNYLAMITGDSPGRAVSDLTKGLSTRTPSCMPLGVVDGIDRHALKDLNLS